MNRGESNVNVIYDRYYPVIVDITLIMNRYSHMHKTRSILSQTTRPTISFRSSCPPGRVSEALGCLACQNLK